MAGIHLYSSNRLEKLAHTFTGMVRASPLPPLEKETVLIQSRGMARWLAMETAKRLNIWANCDCPFPNTFVRNIFKLAMPDLPDIPSYDKKSIIWHLMAIFPEVIGDPHCQKVASYLESGDDMKLYQLAFETADLFDQYTLFRPQMILGWEETPQSGPDDYGWQSTVWSHLVNHLRQNHQLPGNHRARLLQIFMDKMMDPAFDHAILPSRVSVFGVSSLPPYHLIILASLAHHIDVHFFIMNPCREYWFDILADRDIVKISRKASAPQNTLHLNRGNSLLASMGHLARDFMTMLQEFQFDDHEFFTDPGLDSLLHNIQQDILDLHENTDPTLHSSHAKKNILVNDTSLVFHSCHSPMREVEILHDQLLDIFNKADVDQPVEPRDILVMAPAIDEYEPLIRSVFDAHPSTPARIPYSIADQSARKSNKYIEKFMQILTLSQRRFSSIDVLGILEAEPVRNRFSIRENDLATIEKWVDETRICWGIDQDHRANLKLPSHRENTWRAGLDRLLLGYAMPGHDHHLFANILPYDHIEGGNAELLGSFLDFTEKLFCQINLLQRPHTLTEWSVILQQVKDKLLLAGEKDEAEERVLHKILLGLQQIQELTSYNKEVSLGVIRSFLISSLDEHFAPIAGSTGFLTGGVTFCSMLPMRSIPFKVICLLGMNDGLYPRSGKRISFDLMALAPKPGDRSKRYDDRYLFLETILSARQKLSISFVGQSIQDGVKRPPSVLVSELMDYIDRGYTVSQNHSKSLGECSDHLTTLHHLQPFHPDYFNPRPDIQPARLFSYSAENCAAARALSLEQKKAAPVLTTPLSTPPDEFKQVGLHELVRFFSHPVRYLLVNIIGIHPIEESRMMATSEPFTLKGLAGYKLENDILQELLQGRDCKDLYAVKKAAGELPHGMLGKIYFAEALSKVQPFHTMLVEFLAGEKMAQRQVNLSIGDYTITGRLDNLSPAGLLQYRYASLKPRDMIRSWINHLVLNSMDDPATQETFGNTIYAAKDFIYKYNPVSDSRHHLELLLDLYWQGLSEPLYFFPNTSLVFAQAINKGKEEQEARRQALTEWEGNSYNRKGEKNDPYNLICCKNMDLSEARFMEPAKKFFVAALTHREKIPFRRLKLELSKINWPAAKS